MTKHVKHIYWNYDEWVSLARTYLKLRNEFEKKRSPAYKFLNEIQMVLPVERRRVIENAKPTINKLKTIASDLDKKKNAMLANRVNKSDEFIFAYNAEATDELINAIVEKHVAIFEKAYRLHIADRIDRKIQQRLQQTQSVTKRDLEAVIGDRLATELSKITDVANDVLLSVQIPSVDGSSVEPSTVVQ